MKNSTLFQMGFDTRALYDRIITAEVGDVLTYATLSKVINADVQKTSALDSARKIAQRDRQVVFGTIRNVGIQRLSDAEIVHTGHAALGEVRRAAQRGVRRITAIADFAALPNELKTRHNATVSMLGAVALMAKPKSVQRIESAVSTSQTGALSIGRTLELFRRPSAVDEPEPERAKG